MFLKFFGKKEKANGATLVTKAEESFGVDVEMNYCPSCGDEYRLGVEACVSCNITLISGSEKLAQAKLDVEQLLSRTMEISSEDNLVTIQKGPLNEMKKLQKLLAGQRVPGVIAGDENSCSKGCCGGSEMFLQIRKEDSDVAMEILAKDFIKSTALSGHDLTTSSAVFDHLAKETVCPACGCSFSPTVGACPDCGLSFE